MADIFNNVITTFKTIMTGQKAVAQSANALKTVGDASKRGSVALKTLTEASRGLNTPLTVTARSFQKANLSILAGGKIMQNTTGKILNMKQAMREVNKSNRQFQMGFLSMMFAAMALNRVLGTFLRGAITAYAKATGETNAFRKVTNKLTASWEFFKFSLIDALANSSMFATIIQWTTQLVNWFNKLTPATKTWIGLGLGFAFILSLLIMIVGQVGLAKGGFEVMGDLFATSSSKIAGSLSGVLISIAAWAVLILFLWQVGKGFFKFWSSEMDEAKKKTEDTTATMVKSFGKNFIEVFKFLGQATGGFIAMMVLNMIDLGIALFRAFRAISITIRNIWKMMWLKVAIVTAERINKLIKMVESTINKLRSALGMKNISFGKIDTSELKKSIREAQKAIVNLPSPEEKLQQISDRTMRWVDGIGAGVEKMNDKLINLNTLSLTGQAKTLSGGDLSQPGITSGNTQINNQFTFPNMEVIAGDVGANAADIHDQAVAAGSEFEETLERKLNESLGPNNI